MSLRFNLDAMSGHWHAWLNVYTSLRMSLNISLSKCSAFEVLPRAEVGVQESIRGQQIHIDCDIVMPYSSFRVTYLPIHPISQTWVSLLRHIHDTETPSKLIPCGVPHQSCGTCRTSTHRHSHRNLVGLGHLNPDASLPSTGGMMSSLSGRSNPAALQR
jgi:hypothetical protein